MVSTCAETCFGGQLHSAESGPSVVFAETRKSTSLNINADGGFQVVREQLTRAGIPTETAAIIGASWRSSTSKQYGSYFKKWVHFCSEQQIDAINPSLNEILTFLTHLSSSKLGYSSINSAKSMLSSLFSLLYKRDIGTEPLIRHFMKGIFNMKPSLPRYVNTWDVQTVISYLDSLNTLEVSLKLLSVKLTTLLALTTGQRCQTLWAIQVNDIEISEEFMKVRISKLLKQSKVNNHLREMYFEPFVKNSNICVIQCMKTYLEKTQELRKISSAENLFIITQKPYNSATKSTISRWIKLALKWAGIDIKTFSTHSTRSASTSAVLGKIPLDTILKTAGWSKDSTFRKFYNRPVSNSSEFSHAVF